MGSPARARSNGATWSGCALDTRARWHWKAGERASSPARRGLATHLLAREEGVIVRGIRDLVAMSPPLVVTHDELDRMFAGLGRALDRL
jgi:adenosylmethionine-8-amino-7-oxononanoate aminotransferase